MKCNRLAAALAALLLAAIAHPLTAAPQRAAAPQRTAPPTGSVTLEGPRVELPLDLGTRRPMIAVTVNGQGPYWFVVDTGSAGNVIDSGLAAQLTLTSVGVQRVGSPGGPPIEAHRFAIDSLAAEGLQLTGIEAVGIDLAAMAGDTFQGIIGMRSFRDYLVTFDYPGARLVVESGSLTAGAAGTVAYDGGSRLIRIEIDVAGVRLPADLDTGSPASFTLPKAFEDRWTFLSPVIEAGSARLVGAEHPIWRARLDGPITLAGHTFEDPEVGLAEFTADFANVGYETLRHMVLTIDQRQGLVRLTREAAGAAGKAHPGGPAALEASGSKRP